MENSNMENMFGNIVNEEKKNSSENNEETNQIIKMGKKS